MQSSDIPVQFLKAFAADAGVGFVTFPIPVDSQIGITSGRASLTDGFPPLNFLPRQAGGVPPFGDDENGILKMLSLWSQWQGAGAPVFYDSAFSAAIGGYPKGTVLMAVSFANSWVSTAENNTTDPDTGGAGWQALYQGWQNGGAVISAAGAYSITIPAGIFRIKGRSWGGGAGGGGSLSTTGPAGGGGGGAYLEFRANVTPGLVLSGSIGAGGAAGAISGGNGGNGGDTTMTSSGGPAFTSGGGVGGTGGNNSSVGGGAGGAVSGASGITGILSASGLGGGTGVAVAPYIGGSGGSAVTFPGPIGTSLGGTAASFAGTGGAGAGAAGGAASGGGGANGFLILEW